MALTVVGDSEAPRWLLLPWALAKGDADELRRMAWTMGDSEAPWWLRCSGR